MLDYKKTLNITSYNEDTGVLTYKIIYNTYLNDNEERDKEIERLKSHISIVNRIPKDNDKLFFLNDVIIPRFKMKQFHKDNGTALVKYIESSNLVVIGKNTIPSYFEMAYVEDCDSDCLIDYLNDWLVNNHIEEDESLMIDNEWAITLLEKIDDDNIELSNNNWSFRKHLKNEYYHGKTSSARYYLLSEEQYDSLTKILNIKCDVINEEIILKELNNNLTMDVSIYDSIQNLMNSKDNENMKLAMEMMANCDYDTSALYLLLLLKEYYAKINGLQCKNHVNFKAMLHYFDFKPSSNFNIDIEEILTKLKDKRIPLLPLMNVITPLILADFQDDSIHYRAGSIVLLDEEGNDIVEVKTKGEIEIDNCIDEIITSYIDDTSTYEVDDIIYDELSDVITVCADKNLMEYRKIIIDVLSYGESEDALLPIIKFMDDKGYYEQVTVLTQCYLDII